MNISAKQRFLDICHFKRPGDLCMLSHPAQGSVLTEQTLENWIEQGAPKEIIDPDFCRDYFQFQYIRWLGEIRSGLVGKTGEGASPKTDIGHGIMVGGGSGPLIPAYQPRLISEDERTVTWRNAAGQTVKRLKESLKTGWGMSMFLDWPVKDRATWNEHKKLLDPDTPERWPADWNAFVQKMNAKSEPLSLGVGSFYGYLREWIGSERILYMFYDDPGLIEDMMEQVLYL